MDESMEGDLQGKASADWGGTGGHREVYWGYEYTGWPSILEPFLPLGVLTCSGYVGFIFGALCLECVSAFMLCAHVGGRGACIPHPALPPTHQASL